MYKVIETNIYQCSSYDVSPNHRLAPGHAGDHGLMMGTKENEDVGKWNEYHHKS